MKKRSLSAHYQLLEEINLSKNYLYKNIENKYITIFRNKVYKTSIENNNLLTILIAHCVRNNYNKSFSTIHFYQLYFLLIINFASCSYIESFAEGK